MKKWLLLFLLTSLVFAEVSPNQIHPGFRNAIDNGDITTAVALRHQGLPGIYCPATLSTGDAVKLYRDELRNKPELIIQNCSPEFIEKIAVKSCANPNNANLCKSILKRTKVTKWPPMLEKIVENEVYKSTSFTEEMKAAFEVVRASIASNPFSWKKWIQSFTDEIKTISSVEQGQKPSVCFADASCSAQLIVDLYLRDGYVSDDNALFMCRVHPGIDKLISEEKKLNILDCDKLFAAYSEKCDAEPQVIAKNRLDGQGVSYYRCGGETKSWHKVDAVDAGKGAEPCTEDRIGELKQSELDFRIFRCSEDKQWNTYATKMGNTIWATWDARKGGKSPGEKAKSILEQLGKVNLFEKIGHRYTYNEAKDVCPVGWTLPTVEQFNEMKGLVKPEDLLSENWNVENFGDNDEVKKTNKWNFNAYWMEGEYGLSNKAIYWGAEGAQLGIVPKGGHGEYHYEMTASKPSYGALDKCLHMSDMNEKMDFVESNVTKYRGNEIERKCTNYRSEKINQRDPEYKKKSRLECSRAMVKNITDSLNLNWRSYCMNEVMLEHPEKVDMYKAPIQMSGKDYFNERLLVRCVKSDDKLGKPVAPIKNDVASSSKKTPESAISPHKEPLKNEIPEKLEDNLMQEKASAAVESAKQNDGEKSMSTTKLLRIGVFSAVALGGGIAALVFDKKAKNATATPPTNRAEFQKGHDDAKQNQNVRNVSLGVAAAGLVALGLTFLF